MSRKLRMQAEREIVRATIEAAIKRGWLLRGVDNGEDDVETTNDVERAMELAFVCDDARIFFHRPPQDTAVLYIVFGNDGWDVINDYTVNLDEAIDDTDALVEKWEQLLTEEN